VGSLGELTSSEHSSPESSVQRWSLGQPSEARPGWNGGAKGEREEGTTVVSGAEAVAAAGDGRAHTGACDAPRMVGCRRNHHGLVDQHLGSTNLCLAWAGLGLAIRLHASGEIRRTFTIIYQVV